MSEKRSTVGAAIAVIVLMLIVGGFASMIGAPGHAASGAPSSNLSVQEGPTPAATTYKVTFTETGLPSGTTWWITIGDLPPFSSNGNTASTKLPNGVYTYNVSSDNTTYVASNGGFTVNGAPVGVSVPFAPLTYSVTFNASGLPSGDLWYINVTAVSGLQHPSLSGSGATTTLTAQLSNGTYTFKVATNDKRYAPSYYSSPLTVAGANTSAPNVTFTPVTYTVTFNAKFPAGAPAFNWYVNISGQTSLNASGKSISTSLMNGTYSYTVATSNKSYAGKGGSLTVNGAAVAKTISFVLVTYTVEITETGLPSGFEWTFTATNVSSFGSTGTTIITTLPNGTYPYTVSATNTSWAAASGSFTVNGGPAVVPVSFYMVTYTVTFSESGLPSGDSWYVNITAITGTGSPDLVATGATASLTTPLPNGTYSFTVASSDKTWAPSYYTGGFLVNGANLATTGIVFSLVTYTVTFTESGLPTGTEWFINLTNGPSYSSVTNSLSLNEPNGTYAYTYGSANTSWALPGSSFTVTGADVSVTFSFLLVTYGVTFTESGLPAVGSVVSQWWVNLTNGQSFTSTATTIHFIEPNGTYHYSIATVSKRLEAASGAFSVHGGAASVSVAFTPVKLSVVFAGTGLPASKSWFVIFNGTNLTPASGQAMVSVVNGSYPYLIVGPGGWPLTGAPSSGTVIVNGQSVNVHFTFSKGVTYPIRFVESGLPKGASWCVDLASWLRCSTGKFVAYSDLTAGSYAYSVPSMTGQTITAKVGGLSVPLTGTLGVALKGITVVLKYVYPYAVTFTESGLTTGTSWSVTVKGVTLSSTTGSIGFQLPNGTYGFKVGAVSGYTFTVSSHSAKVVGGPVTVTVTFRPKAAHGGSPQALPTWEASLLNALRSVSHLSI